MEDKHTWFTSFVACLIWEVIGAERINNLHARQLIQIYDEDEYEYDEEEEATKLIRENIPLLADF